MELRYGRKTWAGLIVGLLAVLAIGYFALISRGAGVSDIVVDANEFKFVLSSDIAKAGTVKFTVKNTGAIAHEFVLYRAGDAPMVAEMHKMEHAGKMGMVTEEMEKAILAEIEEDELKPGETGSVSVNLAPGVYEIGCHVPGHYEGGMKATLRVT